ncbi:fatty acid desaturase 6 isoform X2 [Peromyscus californicus insignis]|uniref:fatty acid desaturase 6 isoform X2 n=1 Tax=Peromyscus californicus insignis TaxID=564181 RepID=UPI0022A681A0|nr:fatty acid desaturase 6 isoform X2 [Peromyscus californicus insignis]
MEPEQSASPGDGAAEVLLSELERQVQDVVRASSWWERRGVDCAVLAVSLLALPAGFLCLRFHSVLAFTTGITILGICHYTLTVKGSHLATHGALTESKRWNKILMIFFVEVCTAFPAEFVLWTLLVKVAGNHESRLSEAAKLGGKNPGPGPGLSFTYWLVAVGRAFEEGRAEGGTSDIGLHVPGPLFSVLAAPECVGLQEPRFSAGLHAAGQIPAGPPLSPCQHLPAHRIAYVLPGQEAPADSHDEPGGAEPATAATAGLGIWPLAHQLPCGASPLPVAL